MKVVVLGAGGKTGRLVVAQASAAGNVVTAFMRHDEGQFKDMENVTVVIGDAQKQADITRALKDQDAVISTLGSNNPKSSVIHDSTDHVIAAARDSSVSRLIMMSSFLVSPQLQPKGLMKLVTGVMKNMLSDRKIAEAELVKSNLDWTIVHATALTNGPLTASERIISISESAGVTNKISRADVADFLIKQLTDKHALKKSVIVTTK